MTRRFAALFAASMPTFAHTGRTPEVHDIASVWLFKPSILVPLALAALLYQRGRHPKDGIQNWEMRSYWAGWLFLALALVSPIHAAGEVLFSAHMVQHEIVMVLAAPLLTLGRPLIPFLWAMPLAVRRALGELAKHDMLARTWSIATRTSVAGILHGVAIWVWHYPPLFDATLSSDAIHTAQHCSFLFTALLFWWSVFRGAPGPALLSLFVTAVHTSVLGALLTFSATPWYPGYAETTARWNIGPLQDQQLGGVIMWIPAGLSYLIAGVWTASRSLTRTTMTATKAMVLVLACIALASCQDSNRWQRGHELTGGDPVRGGTLISYYGCSSCHTVPGIREANALVGPSLERIAKRDYLAGVLPNSPDNMVHWIEAPDQVHPGTAMPNLNVTTNDAKDIAAYLYTLE
jgi:cytochrome c oxidase assembly factor CtaG